MLIPSIIDGKWHFLGEKEREKNMEVLHCLIFAPLLTHSWQSISPWVLFANCKQRRSQINAMAFTNPPRLAEKLGRPLLGCFVNIFLRCFNIICVLQMQSEKTFQTMCTERVHCWCFRTFAKAKLSLFSTKTVVLIYCVLFSSTYNPPFDCRHLWLYASMTAAVMCRSGLFLYHLPFNGHTAALPNQSIYIA